MRFDTVCEEPILKKRQNIQITLHQGWVQEQHIGNETIIRVFISSTSESNGN